MNSLQIKIDNLLSMLNHVPRAELPGIWDELGRGNWPEALGEPPEEIHDQTASGKIIFMLRHYIEQGIGRKTCLRYYFKKRRGFTEQMFDDWWDSSILLHLEEIEKKCNQCADKDKDKVVDTRSSRLSFLADPLIFFLFGFAFCALLLFVTRF